MQSKGMNNKANNTLSFLGQWTGLAPMSFFKMWNLNFLILMTEVYWVE